ncbi:MAG: SCP2 sterol-binding domain-containing protein [Ectothiorhodospiraceae bacterium]|nr:SCP2 sterol-binding domain-containing protein [Ectothiorhodospiraceae bacterium]
MRPLTPTLLLQPLQLVPQPLLEATVARVAQRVLAEPLEDDALALLAGRIMEVVVSNPAFRLRFTLAGDRLRSAGPGPADVTISGTADDFILLAARRVDPDTLFFQRRLRLSGDTELGLTVKNVLDSVAPAELPVPLKRVLALLADRLHST